MKVTILFQVFCFFFLKTVSSHSAAEWTSRTIYQLLTDRFARSDGSFNQCGNFGDYCGGTFKGILNNLDYIQGMGFDAIWISPIIENTPGGYHGYWAKNLYNINPSFGTADDLRTLVEECHKRDIWVMVDVVANHMGPVGTDFSSIFPFNQSSHYHPWCDVSEYNCFTNEILTCRLASLPDLDQSNPFVRETLLDWISFIVTNYSLDGIRIDTVPYIDKGFWASFQQAAGVYAVGEVESSVDCCVSYEQSALDGTLSYPLFFTLRSVFQSGQSMFNIQNVLQSYSAFPNPQYLGTFIDNHDHARFLNSGSQINAYKSALLYVLFSTGIPIVYYGTEQLFSGGNDPNCREPLWPTRFNTNTDMYNYVTSIVNLRKKLQVWNYPQVQRYADDTFYAFTRGTTFVVLTNSQNSQTRSITYHPYKVGTKLCNFFNMNDCVYVNQQGFSCTVSSFPKIYLPQ